MRAAVHLGRWRLLYRKRVRAAIQALQRSSDDADRIAAQRCRILPALPEHRFDVMHGRPGDGRLDVVPRRGRAVLLSELQGLRVASVVGVVATGVAQVDASDERDVAGRVVAVPDDQHLLMVGAAHTHAHVEQRLRASLLQVLAETPVLPGGESESLGMGTPDQSPYVDPPFVGPSEHLGHLAAGLAGQAFVGVALPVREVDQVALAGRFDPLEQLLEVRLAVDQRANEIACRPRLATAMPRIETRARIAALRGGQEPRKGFVGGHAATVPDHSTATMRLSRGLWWSQSVDAGQPRSARSCISRLHGRRREFESPVLYL